MKAFTRQLTVLASASFFWLLSSIGSEGYLDLDESLGGSVDFSSQSLPEIARTVAGRRLSVNFSPSLNAREAADFLLTPAILTQEAISDSVVPTYPSE